MRTRVGLWIDHRKAVIVALTDQGEEVRLMVSSSEKHLSRSGDRPLSGPYDRMQVPSDDRQQRALTGHLNIYYDAIIASIRGAEAILIFGPGEAKDELRKRLERDRLGALIAGVETADRMTHRQIAARVRRHFGE
jgi:hypothetical protein